MPLPNNEVGLICYKKKTNSDGSIEKEFEIRPSKKGAATGAATGAALGAPFGPAGAAIGAAIGGTIGWIFGPED